MIHVHIQTLLLSPCRLLPSIPSTHLHACWYNGYDYPAVEIGYHPPRGPKASLEAVARHDETWGCTYTFEKKHGNNEGFCGLPWYVDAYIPICWWYRIWRNSFVGGFRTASLKMCFLFDIKSDCFPSTVWARPIGKIWEVSIPIGGVELEGFWSLGRSKMSFPVFLGGLVHQKFWRLVVPSGNPKHLQMVHVPLLRLMEEILHHLISSLSISPIISQGFINICRYSSHRIFWISHQGRCMYLPLAPPGCCAKQ